MSQSFIPLYLLNTKPSNYGDLFCYRSLFSNQSNVGILATASNSTKQQMLKESLRKDQEILVTVLRAFNLLDRTATVLEETTDDDEKIAGNT